jgi:hypothetical protein
MAALFYRCAVLLLSIIAITLYLNLQRTSIPPASIPPVPLDPLPLRANLVKEAYEANHAYQNTEPTIEKSMTIGRLILTNRILTLAATLFRKSSERSSGGATCLLLSFVTWTISYIYMADLAS